MQAPPQCPQCGTSLDSDAPWGLCPRCLARQGAEILSAEHRPEESTSKAGALPPLAADHSPTRFGDYELLNPLAHGGMGVVYRARQLSLNRLVALKMILSGQLATSLEVQRFRIEATAAARLDHPNIVPIYEVGEHEGQHYFTMKLVEGPNLAEALQHGSSPLTLRLLPGEDNPRRKLEQRNERVARLLIKIARAVHFAHQHGILHRDLKPTNILLTDQGEPQLTDFGLAKISEDADALTRSHAVLGSANYMSPEQASGQARLVTAASDIYSLGTILYETLTGRPPFEGATLVETLRAVTEREPTRPSAYNASVDRDLETICLRCLEKAPARRYASAEALAQDLEHWLASEPITARRATASERLVKWARRKPAIAALLAAVLLVGASGLAGVIWQWHQAGAARRLAEQKALGEAQQRERAEATARRLRENLYSADINLAQRALQENNLGRAVELLQKYLPAATATRDEDLRGFEWRYLWKLTRGSESLTLPHDDFVETVVFSPDGHWIATSGREMAVRLWNAASGEPVAVLKGHDKPVQRGAMFFSPNGRFLLAATDKSLCVWDTRSWQLAAQLADAKFPAVFAPDGGTLFAKSLRGVAAWETTSWKSKPAPAGVLAGVGDFRARSLDGQFFAASAPDDPLEQAQVWQAATGRMLTQLPCQIEQPNSWAVSSDGRWLAAGNWLGEVRLWEVPGSREVARWAAHTSPVWSLGFSPDSSTLASAGFDQVVHLWTVTNQVRNGTWRGHFNEVWGVAFSLDGQRLATASKDGTAKVWSATRTPEDTTLTNALPPLLFMRDGQHLIAAKSDRVLVAWDVESRAEIASLPVFDLGGTTATAADIPGDYVAVLILPKLFQVWSRRAPHLTRTFVGLGELAGSVVLSPNQHLLARVEPTGVAVVDVETSRATALTNTSAPMAFAPDSRRLVTTDVDYSLTIWTLAGDAPGSSGRASAHAPADDQSQLTLAATAPKVDRLTTLRGHKWTISAVVFSSDGRLMVTPSVDGTARVWNATNGALLAVLTSHKEGITCAAFTPDGRTLATGSTDDTVKLWSVATFQELLTLTGFGEDVGALSFSPDGRTLAVGCLPSSGGHKGVQVWRAPTLEEINADRAAAASTRLRSATSGNP